jgi:hypothetical protein
MASAQSDNDAPIVLSEADKRRRRQRSLAIAWGLAAIAGMFFIATIVKLRATLGH